MSLGDMSRQVNIAGQKAYDTAASRIMREKQAHDKQLDMRAVDLMKQKISHQRLQHQTVQNQIDRIHRELSRLKAGPRDAHNLDMVRKTESELRALESQSRMIDEDIRTKTQEVNRHSSLKF